MQGGRSIEGAYHALLVAVINRAINDLKLSRKEADQAMAFILSDTCVEWCLELNVDHEAVMEKATALYQRYL
jgi:hypothetical protein